MNVVIHIYQISISISRDAITCMFIAPMRSPLMPPITCDLCKIQYALPPTQCPSTPSSGQSTSQSRKGKLSIQRPLEHETGASDVPWWLQHDPDMFFEWPHCIVALVVLSIIYMRGRVINKTSCGALVKLSELNGRQWPSDYNCFFLSLQSRWVCESSSVNTRTTKLQLHVGPDM